MDRQKLEKLKKQSREESADNVVQRGSVHFRLDPEMMSLLVAQAKEVRVPFGVFARMLMIENLKARASSGKIRGMKQSPTSQSRAVVKSSKRRRA